MTEMMSGRGAPPNLPSFASNPYSQGGSSFTFRKRWGQIDWRKLASIDVDRIAKEMDFRALQQNIMNITFCNIETEEFHNLDPNFIKLFRLSQLMIEYLLHSQQYLSNQCTAVELKLQQVHQDLDKTMAAGKTLDEELKAVKKENRKRRKVIEAYQDMVNSGATGLHTCPVCKRDFISAEYLQSHTYRRHPDHLPKTELHNEIKEQQQLQNNLEAKLLEQMTEQLQASERQLREEIKQKEQEAINLQIKQFEDWKRKEMERMMIEMEEFKKPVLAELEELQREKLLLEKTLHEKEVELMDARSKRQSHLGHLEGAKELLIDEASQLNESKAEIKHLKENLKTQMDEIQTSMRKQDKSWEKRMEKMSTSYQDQLKESSVKLATLERSIKEESRTDKTSKEVKKLKQKIKQQEEMLQLQQEHLTILHSREPSPVHPVLLQDKDESEEESVTITESNEDFSGDKEFFPFPHQPMIKTKYHHNWEDLEKIRQQTEAIVDDTLAGRGITKDAVGLKSSEFEKKMGLLKEEQQQKMLAHYHFANHREISVEKIGKISAIGYKPIPTEKMLLQISLPKRKFTDMSASATAKIMGKPPKPTAKLFSSQTTGKIISFPTELTATNSEKSYSLTTSDSLEDYSSSSDQKDSPPLIQIEQATSDEQHIDPLHQNSVITFQQSTESEDIGGDVGATKQGLAKPSTKQGPTKPSTKRGSAKPSTKQGQPKPSTKQGPAKPSTKQGPAKPSTKQGPAKPSVVEVKSSGIDSPWDDSEDSEDVKATKPSPVIKAKLPSVVEVKSSGTDNSLDKGEDVRTTKPSTVIKAKQSSVVEVKSSGIDSPWDDSEDSEDVIATKPSPVIKAKQPSTVKVKSSGINSPWDSEEDSIEELFAAPQHNGKTSSTPIKAHGKVDDSATKKPAKSTKVTVKKDELDDISLDSFDISISDPNPSQPPKVPMASKNIKPQSRTVTSRSALTSVSLEDFDSDFSDL